MRASVRIQRKLLRGVMKAPAGLRRRLLGPPPRTERGVPMAMDVWTVLALSNLTDRDPLNGGTPAFARRSMHEGIQMVQGRAAPVARLSALTLPGGAPARLYQPAEPGRPLLVYLHGGGWLAGSLDTCDVLCRRICATVGWSVLSVGYRLAPEHPFPAGLDDAVEALRFARRQAGAWEADPARVAIGGDSAGGNIAAAACLALRHTPDAPWLQLLLYPATHLRSETASRKTHFADRFMLTDVQLAASADTYGPPDPLAPLASPLLADSHRDLPPAIVVTAGFDPLRDEGEGYAARLRAAGVAVEHIDASDQLHGFASMDGAVASASRWVEVVLASLATRAR